MIVSYKNDTISGMEHLCRTMHEDRKRVFVDTLKWELQCVGDQERDQFDDDNAVYLVGEDRSGSHRVSVRILDTHRPHILGSIFPELCDNGAPCAPHIKEITRYLASPRAKAGDRLVARNMMARALIEYAQLNGITAYSAVCDIAFLSQILAAGWRCDPLGMPRLVNGAVVGAFCIHVDPDTIERMSRTWRYDRPALALSAPEAVAA